MKKRKTKRGGSYMRVTNVSGGIVRHLESNLWLYVISLLCICTGTVLGIYTLKYMGEIDKTNLTSYFINFTNSITSTEVNNILVLLETIKNNIPILIGLWIVGLTVVGIPIILIIDIFKGFTLGFTIAFIINSMGVKGLWMSLIGVIPQNIIYIPCLIIASVLSMELSLVKLKDKFNKHLAKLHNGNSMSYTITYIMIFLVMVLGFIYESYITPKAIRLIISSIGSGIG
jgi:stage II sporulation protein M